MSKDQKARARNALVESQRGICPYCGKEMAEDDVTFDHVIPKARGGNNGIHNMVACCSACNHKFGHCHSKVKILTVAGLA